MSYPSEQPDRLDTLLAEAKRRGHRRRARRRAGLAGSALAASAVVLILALLGTSGGRATQLNVAGPHRASPQPSATGSLSPTPSPSPTQARFVHPGSKPSPSPSITQPSPTAASPRGPGAPPLHFQDLAFRSSQEGWAAGFDPAGAHHVLVTHSLDGGATWSAPVIVANSSPGPVAVRFADYLHGFVSGDFGLFATADGGKTWSDTSVSGAVGPVQRAGGNAWALQYPCANLGACAPQLISATLPGGSWGPAAHQPPLGAGNYQLLRVSASQALIGGVSAQGSPTLVQSTDAGVSWQRLTNPCTGPFDNQLASLDGVTIWMACSGSSAAGSQGKQVYVSKDDAKTWTLRASVGIDPATGSGLPLSGLIAKLALSSPGSGFLGTSRGGLLGSTDGGASWHNLGSWDGAGGFDALWFVDAAHGWAAACDGLHRSLDGGLTWSSIGSWPGSTGSC